MLPLTAASQASCSMRKGQPTTVTYPRRQHMGPGQLMLLMASGLGLEGKGSLTEYEGKKIWLYKRQY